MASAEKTVVPGKSERKRSDSQSKAPKTPKLLKANVETTSGAANNDSEGSMVKLQIPFEVLVETLTQLSLDDKERLWLMLQDQISQEETDWLMNDPQTQADIAQALADYEAGDYVTLEEFHAQRSRQPHKKK